MADSAAGMGEHRAAPGSFHAVYLQVAPWLLSFILLASFYVDVYFAQLYLREIAIGLNLLLLCFHLIFASTNVEKDLRIAILPLVAIVIAMWFWAHLFRLHTGAPLWPSFAASRFWLFYLIAPNVYYAHKLGVSEDRLVRALYVSLVALVIVAVAAEIVRDPGRLSASGNYHLTRVDAWRGARLLLPYYALTLAFVSSIAVFFQRPFRFSWAGSAFLLLASYLWVATLPRVLDAALIGAVGVYYMVLRGHGDRRVVSRVLFAMAAIVGAVLVATYATDIVALVRYDASYMTRMNTLQTCLDEIGKHFWLGYGVGSNFSLSLQDIYGPKFYPVDVGIVGIWFQFGLVGVLLYAAIGIAALRSALRLHNGFGDRETPALVQSLVIWTLAMLAASVSAPALIVLDGVPLTAYLFGLALVVRERQADVLTSARTDASTPIFR